MVMISVVLVTVAACDEYYYIYCTVLMVLPVVLHTILALML